MKRVLLIIAYSLVTTTNHCAAAAADAPGPRALALLEDANRRTSSSTFREAPTLRRSKSDSCLARRGRTKGMNDLSRFSRDTSPTNNVFTDDDNDSDQRSPSLTQTPFPPAPQLNLPAQNEHIEPPTRCSLGNLVAAHRAVRTFWDPIKITRASVLPVAGWLTFRTPWAPRLFPNLFTRSGETSRIVTYSLAIATGAAGLWVAKDHILANIYIGAAQYNLRLTQRELATMQTQIAELKELQNASAQQITDMENALDKAKTNAVNAREGIERLLTNVQELAAQITDNSSNAVHVREVKELQVRLTGLEKLLHTIVLTKDQEAVANGPDLDAMAREADKLAEAATHFARMNDEETNAAFATAAVKKAKKKKRFGLW